MQIDSCSSVFLFLILWDRLRYARIPVHRYMGYAYYL
jgi:hypothetical protein